MLRKNTLYVLFFCALMFLCACSQKEATEINPEIATNEAVPANYVANVYLMDQWKEDKKAEKKVYYTTLLAFSEDYYAAPAKEDVMLLSDTEYKPLESVIKGSSVSVYQVNKEYQKGICTYIKIASPEMLDTQKIYVSLYGPAEYDENTLTKDAYIKKNSSEEGWCDLLVSVSEKSLPDMAASDMQISIYEGVLRFDDELYSQYYYYSDCTEIKKEDNKYLTKITIVPLNNGETIDNMISYLLQNGSFSMSSDINNTEQFIDLDEELEFIYEQDTDGLWIGFQSKNGYALDTFIEKIPKAIIYLHGVDQCILLQPIQ